MEEVNVSRFHALTFDLFAETRDQRWFGERDFIPMPLMIKMKDMKMSYDPNNVF